MNAPSNGDAERSAQMKRPARQSEFPGDDALAAR
jgi:hypothetical protein